MNEMSQKEIVLDYLNNAYSEAKINNNVEMMRRLYRAIVAFSYNNFKKEVNWDDMVTEYFAF